jgi:hypothetical protein
LTTYILFFFCPNNTSLPKKNSPIKRPPVQAIPCDNFLNKATYGNQLPGYKDVTDWDTLVCIIMLINILISQSFKFFKYKLDVM